MTLMSLFRLLHQNADVLQHHCGQRRRVVIVCRRTSCAVVRGVCLSSPIVCHCTADYRPGIRTPAFSTVLVNGWAQRTTFTFLTTLLFSCSHRNMASVSANPFLPCNHSYWLWIIPLSFSSSRPSQNTKKIFLISFMIRELITSSKSSASWGHYTNT